MAFAGWVNRFQQDAIEYLKEENRVVREQLPGASAAGQDGLVCWKRYASSWSGW